MGQSLNSQDFTTPRATSHPPRQTVPPEMTEQFPIFPPSTNHGTKSGLDARAEPGVTVTYIQVADK